METIRANHSIQNLENPKARWGYTSEQVGEANPLWEDVMEAAELASPLFLLNITLNRDKEITGVFAGDLREAHLKGMCICQRDCHGGTGPAIRHCDHQQLGIPLDLNVYQSVKGMSAAERIVKKGGAIIMAAECWDGNPGGK